MLVNLLALLNVIYLIWARTGNFDWLEKLPWGTFLTDLSVIYELSTLPSDSVLIIWLLMSIGLCLIWLISGAAQKDNSLINKPAQPSAVEIRQEAIESQPDFQEKLKNLQRRLG
ncbi:MAG: hypothetical protein ACO24Y_09720 [Hylemonella sp.]